MKWYIFLMAFGWQAVILLLPSCWYIDKRFSDIPEKEKVLYKKNEMVCFPVYIYVC